jgi:hypothetical protein
MLSKIFFVKGLDRVLVICPSRLGKYSIASKRSRKSISHAKPVRSLKSQATFDLVVLQSHWPTTAEALLDHDRFHGSPFDPVKGLI